MIFICRFSIVFSPLSSLHLFAEGNKKVLKGSCIVFLSKHLVQGSKSSFVFEDKVSFRSILTRLVSGEIQGS